MNQFKKILIAAFILANLPGYSFSEKKNTNKPNILLIVVDDLGYADFEPFENHDSKISTPNMARLGEEGVVYTNAYTTAPVCSPSRAGLNTGKYQFRWDEKASWNPGLPENVKTIAEYVKESGYTTARIGKNDYGINYHMNDVREYPNNHGYDEFLGFCAHAHDYWLLSDEIAKRTPDPLGNSAHLGPLMHNFGKKSYSEGYLTDIFTDEAIEYLKTKKDKPFFLTLSYNSVHHLIHEVPQKYLDKYDVNPIANYNPDNMNAFDKSTPGSYQDYYDRHAVLGFIEDADMRKFYLANLNCLDDNIGRILNTIKEQDLKKETLILFISDNGGSPLTGANNTPLTAGKYTLWEGGIRVPMAICWPGKIKEGKVEANYVSATDILPTIAHAAGADYNNDVLDGVSLLDGKTESNRLLVWKWKSSWAVREGKWKLIYTKASKPNNKYTSLIIEPVHKETGIKLFDLENDPAEKNNLASSNPQKAEELKLKYEDWCQQNIGKY